MIYCIISYLMVYYDRSIIMESKIFVVFVVEFVSCECSGLFLWYVDV